MNNIAMAQMHKILEEEMAICNLHHGWPEEFNPLHESYILKMGGTYTAFLFAETATILEFWVARRDSLSMIKEFLISMLVGL